MKTLSDIYGRAAGCILRFLVRLIYRPKLYLDAPLPPGVYIFAANHDILFDGPILVTALEKFGKTGALMAKEWFEKPLLTPIFRSVGCIPINREAPASVAWMRESIRRLEAGSHFLIFPEGHTNRSGEIAEFKVGTVMLDHRCNVPVVPVWHSMPRPFKKTVIRLGTPVILPRDLSVRNEGEAVSAELRRAVIALSEG